MKIIGTNNLSFTGLRSSFDRATTVVAEEGLKFAAGAANAPSHPISAGLASKALFDWAEALNSNPGPLNVFGAARRICAAAASKIGKK